MITDAAIAVLFGVAFGLGCWSLLTVTARWGSPSLARRIAPYVRDVVDSREMPYGDLTGGRVWRDTAARARDRMSSLLGGAESVSRRLEQAGRPGGVERFRGQQLAWGLGGLAAGGVLVIALALAGSLSPPAVVLPVLTGVTAMALCDAALSAAARRRVARIHDELPTVLEFLSLCLAAGEPLLDSLRRVGAVGAGELVGELRAAVVDVGTGSSLAAALEGVSRRLHMPAVARTIDQLVAAIERGAPLAAVLQAQASDTREDAKRALIERAGKNEVGMLVPLVFLILPLSVLFAVFPGVFLLQLGLG